MHDPLANRIVGATDPAVRHWPITPSDDTDLAIRPRALFVAASGNLAFRDEEGEDQTYPVQAGMILPFRPVRVLASGTTATVIGWA